MSKKPFDAPPAPGSTVSEEAAMPYTPAPAGQMQGAIDTEIEKQLMRIEGVEGVGVTRDAIGDEAIIVYVRDESVATQIPRAVNGIPTVTEVTGVVRPLPR